MEALEIPLTRGFVAIIDKHLWETELTYNRRSGASVSFRPCDASWHAAKNRNEWYAFGSFGGFPALSLHRLLTQCPANLLVDHRDGNTMDNRLDNLRCCTIQQNTMNAGRIHAGTSKYRGVKLVRGRKWEAQIHWHDGTKKRCKHIGVFATEEEAALARDEAAKIYHGEFARLNFPQGATA